MSKDLWDLAERAEDLIGKTNFQGMTQDEIIGLFYLKFCEPTLAEKLKQEEKERQYKLKINWMLNNGFKKELLNNTEVYLYKDNNLTFCKEDIDLYSLHDIQAFVKISEIN